MRQFEVSIENKGAIADVSDALAKLGINIKAISTELKDGMGIVKFVTEDEELTRKALKMANLNFSEYEIMPVELEDKPGEFARLTKLLADMGIDIESVFLLTREEGVAKLALKVNDLEKAKKLFK